MKNSYTAKVSESSGGWVELLKEKQKADPVFDYQGVFSSCLDLVDRGSFSDRFSFDIKDFVGKLVNSLPERYQLVVKNLYGFEQNPVYGFALAKLLGGVTKPVVYHTDKKALKLMKMLLLRLLYPNRKKCWGRRVVVLVGVERENVLEILEKFGCDVNFL